MRGFAPILSCLILAALVSPVLAAPLPPPPLRYAVEADGTSSAQSAAPVPAPPPAVSAAPLRYSVEQAPLPPVDTRQPAAVPQPQPQAAGAVLRPAPAMHRVSPVATAPGYRLGSGDKVHVTVYGESDLTGNFDISGTGQIAFPLIGDVQAAGLTAPQLGSELATKLAAGYLIAPRVAVEVAAYRPFYIVGQVNKPGEYPYVNGMTALNAIALGGGYTPRADEGVIYVRHEGQVSETREEVNEATKIEPGDVVRVAESDFWIAMSFLQPLTGTMAAARYGVQ